MLEKEERKISYDILQEYRAKFGCMDTFGAPDITADRLNGLMKKALDEGKEIDYEKEGWYIPTGDELV